MARILDCDLGNTRYKWRLQERGTTLAEGVGRSGEALPRPAELGAVDRIRVATVAGDAVLNDFLQALQDFRVDPEIAVTQRQVAGVSNAYGDQFTRLGVDRWLALVAGYKRVGGPVLVLDAGSALTADLVDASGAHLGGYIIPGLALMKGALFQDTEKVLFDPELDIATLALGCSTQQAVSAGVMAAQVGAASIAIAESERRIRQDFAILVTGGDAGQLIPFLPDRAVWVPDLVLDGLQWVLP